MARVVCTIRAKRVGTIKSIANRDDLTLVESDVDYIKEHFGRKAAVMQFDGFFVAVKDGDYSEVYGYRGTVPRLDKDLYKVTQTCKVRR